MHVFVGYIYINLYFAWAFLEFVWVEGQRYSAPLCIMNLVWCILSIQKILV